MTCNGCKVVLADTQTTCPFCGHPATDVDGLKVARSGHGDIYTPSRKREDK